MPYRWLVTVLTVALALAASAPAAARSVAELEEFLARKRTYSEQERRAVLSLIEADVPDAKGRFKPTRKGQIKNEDLDWLAALSKLPEDTRGLAEVVADVEAIRELAASTDFDAGRALLDFAFSDNGLLYRDECGRYLREMSPISLPALIRASKIDKRYSNKRRYARYQLERLDREHPLKALAYAGSERTQLAVLQAYQDVLHREAVLAVLRYVDHVSPRVRAKAREAWTAYITGPAPPEAPKKKLQLPGGKLTDEEMPLYLTHRELADIYLRRTFEELTGESAPRRIKLTELTKQVFDIYDQRRAAGYVESLERGLELAAQQKPAQAAVIFDEILGAAPQFERRAEMAPAFVALGAEAKRAKDWTAAAVAYAKAAAVASDDAIVKRALAEQHYVEGRLLAQAGRDPEASFRKALELDPQHKGANAAVAGDDPDEAEAPGAGKPRWVFYAGVAGGACALLLLFVATRRRHG